MLESTLAHQLKGFLSNVTSPIELVAAVDQSPAGTELVELLTEIAEMSPLITLDLAGEAEAMGGRLPSFGIRQAGASEPRVVFAGIPLGHEFTSLVLALLHTGGHPAKQATELLDRIRDIPGEHRFETFLSLSCQNCPDVVQALNLMATLNPSITHVAIDGALFQEEADARGVLAVPMVFHNGQVFGRGRMTLEEIVDKLDVTAAERRAERVAELDPFDVLVIGGGPAGTTAAIYAARKGIRTGLVAERLGGQVLDTMAIENFVSVPRTEGPQLAASLEKHVREYDVEVLSAHRALALRPASQPGGLAEVELAGGGVLRARTVVLALGARWRQMGVPGEADYLTRGVTFCPHCDGPLFKGKRVAVIGGGNSGVEAAIDLAGVVGHVTVLEFDQRLRADEVLQRTLRGLPNVDVRLAARTTEVLGDGTSVTGLSYVDRSTDEANHLPLEGVFVQIGLLPSTDWLADAVDLTPRGEIVIDPAGRTSAPGIFAAGDCTTVPFKQILVAMGAGATAALSAFDHLIRETGRAGASAPAEAGLAG